MSHLVLLQRVPLFCGHIPRGIKYLNAGVPEVGVQPLGRHDGLRPRQVVHAGGVRHRGERRRRRRGVAPRRDPERARQRRRAAPEPAGALRRARRPPDPALGERAPREEVAGPRRAAERRSGGAGEERGRHGVGFWFWTGVLEGSGRGSGGGWGGERGYEMGFDADVRRHVAGWRAALLVVCPSIRRLRWAASALDLETTAA